jgi:hypothetical protein
MPKRISYFLNSTTYGYILNSTGIRCLSYQQFCQITAKFSYPVGIGQYHHTLLYIQSAGSGDAGPAIYHMFDNTKPTGAYVGQIRNVTQMRNTEAVFGSSIEYTGALDGMDNCPIYADIYVLIHYSITSLS